MNETELARLVVRLLGDATSYLGMLRSATTATRTVSREIRDHSQFIEGYGRTVVNFGNNVRLAFLGGIGVVGAFGTAMSAIQRSMKMEQTEIAFKVLVGNTKLAQKTLEDLRVFAAETPFELPEVLSAAKQMIAFGETAANIVPTMRVLGDVSSGLQIPLGSLVYLFGTLKAQGRAFTVDINQFAMRGIPIWKQLEIQMGMSNAQVRKMVEEGKVGFAEVEKAFNATTGPMARFRGIMIEQSRSLGGLWSTFKDEAGAALTIVGDQLVKTFNLKEGLTGLITGAAEFKKWVKVVADGLAFVKNSIMDWIRANRELVMTVLKVAGALTALWLTVKAGGVLVGALLAVIRLLKIDLILSTILWAAWSVVILATKIPLFLITAAVWAFNAALAVMDALLAPAGLIAAALVLGIIGAAFGGILVVTAGLVGTVTDLIRAFAKLEGFGKSLGQFEKIFAAWANFISDIKESAQVDFAFTWKLLVLYATLAVEQIKDMWPPLWEFVRATAEATWQLIGVSFTANMTKVLTGIARDFLLIFKPLGLVGNAVANEIEKNLDRMDKRASRDVRRAGVDFARNMADALDKFQIKEGPGAAAARKAIDDLKAQMRQFLAVRNAFRKVFGGTDADDKAPPVLEKTEEAAKKAHKAVEKLQGVLAGSNEGFQRLLEQRDMLAGDKPLPKAGNTFVVSQVKTEKLLERIAKGVEKDKNAGLMLWPANIGGG